MRNKKNYSLYGCPICGARPNIDRRGSEINIECCVSMSLQKCDELTLEERATWDDNTSFYSDDAERKVLGIILKKWDTRTEFPGHLYVIAVL